LYTNFVATIFDIMAGKPRPNRATVKTNVLRIRLTPAERLRLDKAAGLQGAETSTWARRKLLALVERLLGKK
jgi:hypothetical protein